MFHQCRLSLLTSDSYGWSDQDPLAFPYHRLCRTLLERYLSPDRPLSDDVLYEVVYKQHDEAGGRKGVWGMRTMYIMIKGIDIDNGTY